MLAPSLARVRAWLSGLAAVLVLSVSIAPRAAAWSHNSMVNDVVGSASGSQIAPVAIADGNGGMFVAWMDHRAASYDIYVNHLTRTGQIAAGWNAAGIPVCTVANDQMYPVMVLDGSGGVILAWEDHRNATSDIYAQRVSSGGTALWAVNGIPVGAGTPQAIARDDALPRMISDGTGGAYITWQLTFTLGSDYDVYATRITAAGTPAAGWGAGGNAVVTPISAQIRPDICNDGLGGVFIAYADNGGGTYDIRMVRVSGAGVLGGAPSNVSTAAGDQLDPLILADGGGGAYVAYESGTTLSLMHMNSAGEGFAGWTNTTVASYGIGVVILNALVSDGSGGAYLTWAHPNGDYDLFVQHIGANDLPGGSWPINGALLPGGPSPGGPGASALVPDGTQGVIVAFEAGDNSIRALRYLFGGGLAPGWPSAGTMVANGAGGHIAPTVTSDARGGALIAWDDGRNGDEIYGDRVERFGRLGDPEPAIAGVRDVSNDQGGQVRVSWTPSYVDSDPIYGVSQYLVFRQSPVKLAETAIRDGRAIATTPEEAEAERMARGAAGPAGATVADARTCYLVTRDAAQAVIYWEQLAQVPAQALPGYSLVAATTGDSIGGSNPYTLFMIEALPTAGGQWFSAPDSGYSVDNLPPLAPAPFSATWVTGGGALLAWGPNAESDLAGYRIYKGADASFVPGPGNLVKQTTQTSWTDPVPGTSTYKLSAVDAHGNESGFAIAAPGAPTAVDPELPRELALADVAPHPARAGGTIRFALPVATTVRLALYDTQGREVRVLADGARPAGNHSLRWDGDDERGAPLAGGIYFMRLAAGGETRVRRVVVVR